MKRFCLVLLIPFIMQMSGRAEILITGIMHGTLTGGKPKAIELYISGAEDLGGYKVWRSLNGAPFGSGAGAIASLSGLYENTFLYLVKPDCVTDFHNIFGSTGIYANVLSMGIVTGNGNDGFQIRDTSGTVIIDQVWLADVSYSYQDSFWYRNHGTGPDGGWVVANWYSPGNGALVGLDEAGIRAAVPFGSYSVMWAGPGPDWDGPGNWSSGLVPGLNTNVIIPENSTVQPIITNDPGSPAVCRNLYISTDDILTVDPGKAITISGFLKLQPFWGARTSGQLILKSANSQEPAGSMIVYGTISGHVAIERYIAKNNQWHFLSCPVDSQLIRPGFVPDPLDQTVDFYKWDVDEQTEKAWINIRDSSGNLNPSFETQFYIGRGYLVAFAAENGGDSVRTFFGEPNHDSMDIPLSYAGNYWNLVGNPYPSGIDWSSGGVIKTSVAASAMYIWDPSLNNGTGGYRTHNGTIGVPLGTTPFIPSMQGFFVQSSEAGSIRIQPDSYEPLVHSDQDFYKTMPELPDDRLRLRAVYSGYADETLVYFDPAATNEFDTQFDVCKLFAEIDSLPEIYTVAGGEHSLCINIISDVPADIPLNIHSGFEADMTLQAFDFDELNPDMGIYLEDIANQLIINLREQQSFEFHAETGENENRFVLHFINAVNVKEPQGPGSMEIILLNNRITIINPGKSRGQVGLYNLAGQEIAVTALTGIPEQALQISVSPGLYIISVVTAGNSCREKLFIL
jgi:hypothetical protein